MGVNDYFSGFKDGLKLNNDLDSWVHGPHWDVIADLRTEIGGIDKIRLREDGSVMNGTTEIGKIKMNWGE